MLQVSERILPVVLASAVLMLGCGEVVHLADASLPDASPPPDAERFGRVTVHLGAGGMPRVNTPIFYHEVDGTYAGTVMTDAEGIAVIDQMPIGGWVTGVGDPYFFDDPRPFYTSVAGVQPDDEIFLEGAPIFGRQGVGTLNVTMPAALANASSYQAFAGCDSESTPTAGSQLSLSLLGCLNGAGNVDLAVYALDVNNRRIGSIVRSNITLRELDGEMVGSVNLSTVAWTTFLADINVDAANAPVKGSLSMTVAGIREGVVIDSNNVSAEVEVGGAVQQNARLADSFYQGVTATAQLNVDGAMGGGTLTLIINGGAPPAADMVQNLQIDLARDLLPPLGPATVSETLPRRVQLTPPDGLRCRDNPGPPDVVFYGIVASTAEPMPLSLVPGPNASEYTWIVMAPGDVAGDLGQGLGFPQLDPEMAAVLWPEEQFVQSLGLAVFSSDSMLTYDDFRTSPRALTELLLPASVSTLPGTRCYTTSDSF